MRCCRLRRAGRSRRPFGSHVPHLHVVAHVATDRDLPCDQLLPAFALPPSQPPPSRRPIRRPRLPRRTPARSPVPCPTLPPSRVLPCFQKTNSSTNSCSLACHGSTWFVAQAPWHS